MGLFDLSREAKKSATPQATIRQTAGAVAEGLAADRIEGVRLLHLGKISSDSRLFSVLKIQDENGRRSGIKCFIGKQCGKA